MSFEDIKTFVIVLFAICAAITTLGGTINMIAKWKKESKLEMHDKALKEHELRIKKLEDDTHDQESFTKVLCNSVLALVSHEINGNSIDKLEYAQEALQDFLINK